MKLGRFLHDDEPRIGVFENSTVYDITEAHSTFESTLEQVVEGGGLDADPSDEYSPDEIAYLPPSGPSNTVFAAALNYRSHIDEGYESAVPEWPLIFLKLYRSLIGHQEAIQYDSSITQELDYEAELAAVVGTPARHVSRETALDHVAGFTILNDTSARDIQRVNIGDVERLDWFSGKALQSSTPVGPYLVTRGALPPPDELHIESRLNGELMQDESTSLMIRGVSELVSFISSRVRLEPGDIIATGTPEGVGIFQDIQLNEGDEVEITIDGIGTLTNQVVEV